MLVGVSSTSFPLLTFWHLTLVTVLSPSSGELDSTALLTLTRREAPKDCSGAGLSSKSSNDEDAGWEEEEEEVADGLEPEMEEEDEIEVKKLPGQSGEK